MALSSLIEGFHSVQKSMYHTILIEPLIVPVLSANWSSMMISDKLCGDIDMYSYRMDATIVWPPKLDRIFIKDAPKS